jgi:hypothetical protein
MEMHCASLLDLVEGRLLDGDVGGAYVELDRATAEVTRFSGTMAWHHRQRLAVQRARAALAAGDRDAARDLAVPVAGDAPTAAASRYELLARAVVACADGAAVDHDTTDEVLAALGRRAGLEAWRVTAEVAAATGTERWWRDAEHRAGALVAAAGDDADALLVSVTRRFERLRGG